MADIAILISLTIIIVYAFDELKSNDWQFKLEGKTPLNTKSFLSFIGMSVYFFEGIGMIIPI